MPFEQHATSVEECQVRAWPGHDALTSGGWCARCRTVHTLPVAGAREECFALMDQLRRHRRLDWLVAVVDADPRCSTDALFGDGGGKMFGVLCGKNAQGNQVVLRAFSGQLNGLWQVDGWVDPILDASIFAELVHEPEREIKKIGLEMAQAAVGSSRYRQLKRERRARSRQLMRDIHGLYRLVNFRGEVAALTEVYLGDGDPPSGTGDCCAPKLLHHAATNGIRPEAMAEFFWGRDNASGTRSHARLYPACAAKCTPILGFQLCGLP